MGKRDDIENEMAMLKTRTEGYKHGKVAGLKEALEIAESSPPWALPGAIRRIRSRIEELEKGSE